MNRGKTREGKKKRKMNGLVGHQHTFCLFNLALDWPRFGVEGQKAINGLCIMGKNSCSRNKRPKSKQGYFQVKQFHKSHTLVKIRMFARLILSNYIKNIEEVSNIFQEKIKKHYCKNKMIQMYVGKKTMNSFREECFGFHRSVKTDLTNV